MPYPLMADFHFLLVSWSLHLNEVFNECCFTCFKEDSSIHLMCETAERCLSRTDFLLGGDLEQHYKLNKIGDCYPHETSRDIA